MFEKNQEFTGLIEAIGSDIVKWGCSGFTVEA